MLSRAMVGDFILGFRVNNINTSLEVSHLLFVDDTLIICDANSEHIHNLDHILLCFGAISGLKINFQKFELAVVGEFPNIKELAGILSCRISSFPMKLPGSSPRCPFKSRAIWDGVVERTEKRMSS
jgi:hypothetical protein